MLILHPSSRSARVSRPRRMLGAGLPTPARRGSPDPAARRRSAFTLVELLTVIIIIGLLMALLVPAVMNARVRALDARMVAEISQMDNSMKEFRTKHGGLPPAVHNPANATRVKAFWRRAWPRWDTTSTTVISLSPAEVLVFYLGGFSNLDLNSPYAPLPGISTKTQGFNMNPTNPAASGGQRTTPLFQFDQARLFDEYPAGGNGFYEYYPPHKREIGDGVPPYVYFDPAAYLPPPLSVGTTTQGYAVPYLDGNSPSGTGYMNANSFQIICAGQDNHFGPDVAKTFPAGTGYGTEDNDNLTNFTTTRLEEAKP